MKSTCNRIQEMTLKFLRASVAFSYKVPGLAQVKDGFVIEQEHEAPYSQGTGLAP